MVSDEDIMPLRGPIWSSILQEATQCSSLALHWFCFRFICSRCFFV